MRALALAAALAAVLALSGCPSVPLVTPYDAAIDTGIVEFYAQLNQFVKDVSDAGGSPEGTYEANRKTYNALETRIDVLILRATSLSQGSGCRLEAKVYERVAKLLENEMPAELKAQGPAGDANGCNARLLQLVKRQLELIREIHKNDDKCEAPSGKELSCLRKATAETALRIANQSINAVSVVEAAKRN